MPQLQSRIREQFQKVQSIILADRFNNISERVNHPDFIKSLLGENRAKSIKNILKVFPFINFDDPEIGKMYLKIMPSLFGLAIINCEDLTDFHVLVEKLEQIPYMSCITKWKSVGLRNGFIKNKQVQCCPINNEFSNIIGYRDIQFFLSVVRYMKYNKLHKYIFLFANLTLREYHQIIKDPTTKIDDLAIKVGLLPITNGGRNTIVRKMADLQSRVEKLSNFVNPVQNYFTDQKKVMLCLAEVKRILHTPIHYNKDHQISELLTKTIEKVARIVFSSDSRDEKLKLSDVLKAAKSCHFFPAENKSTFKNLERAITNSKDSGRHKFNLSASADDYEALIENKCGSLTTIFNGMNIKSMSVEELLDQNIRIISSYLIKLVDE